jgi:hypothetical protein
LAEVCTQKKSLFENDRLGGNCMAFKLSKKSEISHADPESLFRDLRSRKVEGLLSQQADMLREYMKYKSDSDIALELPTGSGKTLVGLLIAEWRRVREKRPALFICPTKQLVHQVAEQASEKYGIETVKFVGSKYDYSSEDKTRFLNCEVVGVTNYSSLFNFNPFFKDIGTIIFDDAHAAENYVSKCWSLEILQGNSKHVSLFNSIIGLIGDHIPEHDRLSFQNDEECPVDSEWVNLLPLSKFWNIKKALIAILDEYAGDSELIFAWKMMRENLNACCIYYTNRSFLIRPIIPPTEQFAPFSTVGQRIYMSATLGEGGDLERLFGTYRMRRISAPEGWDRQGIGRRFFLLPMCKLDEQESKKVAVKWIRKFSRAVIIAPSNIEAKEYCDIVENELGDDGYEIFSPSMLEITKKDFVSHSKAVAILANRYDGIDLNGEDCRYLIVSGLPEATNLQERFLMSRMAANVMFRVRIRTRITQAVGRCTRSSTDWALVVLIGEKAHNYFSTPEHRKKFHPEFQAELEFGLEQSKLDDFCEVESNIDLFISQNKDWKAADSHIIEQRDKLEKDLEPSTAVLAETVSNEVRYANALWNGNYEEALSSATDIVSQLSGDELRGYRAWWYYLAGNAAYLGAKELSKGHLLKEAKRLYSSAATAVPTLAWLKQLEADLSEGAPEDTTVKIELSEILERMEQQFERIGKSTSKKLERKFKLIRDGLLSKDADEYETSQVLLGELLGYISRNSAEDSAPDPWWVLNNKKGLVFEDYTATTGENPRVGKGKIIQAKGHLEWLTEEHPGVDFSVILCTTAQSATDDSKRFQKDIYYLHVDDMQSFGERALKVLRILWDAYSAPGDVAWRESAIDILSMEKLLPNDVFSELTKTPMESLSN